VVVSDINNNKRSSPSSSSSSSSLPLPADMKILRLEGAWEYMAKVPTDLQYEQVLKVAKDLWVMQAFHRPRPYLPVTTTQMVTTSVDRNHYYHSIAKEKPSCHQNAPSGSR
jgi:hypothetical protein